VSEIKKAKVVDRPEIGLTEKHPYLGQPFLKKKKIEKRILSSVNKGRGYRGKAVETTYYLTAKLHPHLSLRASLPLREWVPRIKERGAPEFQEVENAIGMMLIHGTTENWPGPGKEPATYKKHTSWLKEIKFLKADSQKESALVTISTPLKFFDTTSNGVPLAQLRMATQSEPFNGFINFTARVVDYHFPVSFKKKFVGQVWPHKKIREYLKVSKNEPIIGTIVKPKWLPPKLFAQKVTEAALGGVLFVKSDENLHLTKKELAKYVNLTVKMLNKEGFDLLLNPGADKKRFLFAPHITTNAFEVCEYAKIAVDHGANCLMFSPHFSGDFELIRRIYEMGDRYKVPIYAHTAGMNLFCGDPNYSFGEDAKIVYLLAGLSGAAFMQLPAMKGYIRPTAVEKKAIIERLKEENLVGDDGMTLVIAGGLGAENIGYNIKTLGANGKMFLAGTAIFHHPDGIKAGILALKLDIEAAFQGITEVPKLKKYAKSLGKKGAPLLIALKGK